MKMERSDAGNGIVTSGGQAGTECHDNFGYDFRKPLIVPGAIDKKFGHNHAEVKLGVTMREYSILFIRTEEAAGAKVEKAIEESLDGKVEWSRVDALFDGLRLLQERGYDLLISDLFLPDGQGLATVRHLNQQAPKTPVIVLCHAQDRETAVNAVRKGAHDFFCYEDLDTENLRRSVAGALNTDAGETPKGSGPDRRVNARFPCRLAVSYQALEHPFFSGEAVSETLNISSKGMLFATTEPLQPGQLLQVSVDWPARLENMVPLKLVAEGRIVRNTNGQAAMRIDKYEFRTRKARPAAGTPPASVAGSGTGTNQTATRPTAAGGRAGADSKGVSGGPGSTGIITQPGTAAGNRTNGAKERRNV